MAYEAKPVKASRLPPEAGGFGGGFILYFYNLMESAMSPP